MKNIKFLTLTLTLTLFLASLGGCEKEIPFEADTEKPKLVLNSLFTTDSVWAVHLSSSRSVLDNNDLGPVAGAAVIIQDDAGNTLSSLTYQGDGLYAADSLRPVPNQTYVVQAAASGFDPISASDAIPGAVQIISLDTTFTYTQDSTLNLDIAVTFADPGGVENYYMIELWQTFTYVELGDTETFTYPVGLTTTDPNVDQEGGFDNTFPYILMRDANFDGQNYRLEFTVEGFFFDKDLAPTANLNLLSSSAAFYNYRRSFFAYQNVDGNPFAQPVQVFSNVDGGFGIFAGGVREIWEIEF